MIRPELITIAFGLLALSQTAHPDEKPAKATPTPEAVFQQFVKLAADGKTEAMLELLTKEHRQLVKDETAQEAKFAADELKAIKALSEALDKKFPKRATDSGLGEPKRDHDKYQRLLRDYQRYTNIVRQEKKAENEVHLKISKVHQTPTGMKREVIATVPMVRVGTDWRIRLPLTEAGMRKRLDALGKAKETYVRGVENLTQAVLAEEHSTRTDAQFQLLKLQSNRLDVLTDIMTAETEEWMKYNEPVDPEKKPAKPPATPEEALQEIVKAAKASDTKAMLAHLTKKERERIQKELADEAEFLPKQNEAIKKFNEALDEAFGRDPLRGAVELFVRKPVQEKALHMMFMAAELMGKETSADGTVTTLRVKFNVAPGRVGISREFPMYATMEEKQWKLAFRDELILTQPRPTDKERHDRIVAAITKSIEAVKAGTYSSRLDAPEACDTMQQKAVEELLKSYKS